MAFCAHLLSIHRAICNITEREEQPLVKRNNQHGFRCNLNMNAPISRYPWCGQLAQVLTLVVIQYSSGSMIVREAKNQSCNDQNAAKILSQHVHAWHLTEADVSTNIFLFGKKIILSETSSNDVTGLLPEQFGQLYQHPTWLSELKYFRSHSE